MSKIVKVNNGNYKVVVSNDSNPANATITLDTGPRTGTVVVTGNLNVQGTTTTIESNNATIKDNIIILNQGETNAYVSLQYSGIQIDRGANLTYGHAQIVYNEKTAIDTDGTIVLRYTIGGTYIPLETNKIDSGGQNLTLFPGTTGAVGVFGTTNYKARVIDDNALTNKGYVDDAISLFFSTNFPPILGSGATRVTTQETPSHEIGFILNNSTKALINSSGFTIDSNINLSYNSITNLSGASNLRLAATNDTIEVDGVLQLDDTTGPTAVAGSTKIYTLNSGTTGPGKTGVYFTSYGNSDELIARRRALLWSMLF
jgi:hypothetical protein